MCRLLLVVDATPQPLLPLVSARRSERRGQLFSLGKDERLHGFGVAWCTGRAAGAVVTTRPPSDDLNIKRVLAATASRLALAFIRSCVCERCPATTYCPASDANTQPFARSDDSGLVVAHVGILHHHRELMSGDSEAGRRAQAAQHCGDAGASDAAFLFRLVASHYDEFEGDLERAVRATLDLVSETGPPASLNLVATDRSGVVVACRRRSPGDGQAPPPLFYASTDAGALLASAPVKWPGVGAWTEVAADSVIVIEDARLREAAPIASKPRPRAVVPPPPPPAPKKTAPQTRPAAAKTDEVGAADAEMRGIIARVASANHGLGAPLAKAKKRRLAALRAGASAAAAVASLEAFAEALANAGAAEKAALVERDRAACDGGWLPRDATTTDAHDAAGADGPTADRGALAENQARLYDARYGPSSAAEGQDRAGVEEVHTAVAREAEAIAEAIAAAVAAVAGAAPVRLLDFGCGNGRCFAAIRAATRARGAALDVMAYDVSEGALRAFRQALIAEQGFTVAYDDDADRRKPGGVIASSAYDGAAAGLGAVENGSGAGRCSVRFVLGSAAAPPEALRSLGSFDVALSGWGTTSAIPDLRNGEGRQEAFLGALCRLAPRLLNVVSSENNFLGPQEKFRDLRRRRTVAVGTEAERLDAALRLATSEGSFYYEVNGEEMFYSAVSPRVEEQRLRAAGFTDVRVSACNIASFRDLLASPRLAKLERAVLKLVDSNQHLRLQLLLTRLAGKAACRRLRRVALLFDPDRTLVDQCARYLVSYARRPPPEG